MHKTSRERERERERESESESSAARGQGSRAARPEGALPARGPSMVVPSLRTPGSLAAGACQRWAPCWDSAGAPACAEPPRPILNPSSGGVAQTPGGEGGGGGGEKAKEGWGWRAAYQASYEASCRAAHRFSISTAHSSLRARLSSRSG
ncbi:unnamed protein product [Prorocentrum cordatum]|uniref:Uncharacterized protein n=1 Tax=Prorocentrum cordatum TaxID=2364126 RepID=A0ABN9VIT1_9DINO|nr:unnamed protein product [Polarella glacialis]